MENRFRELLASGRFLLGTHICTCDSSLTESAGLCGFDYLWIDTEHTAIDYAVLQRHLIAARAANTASIVRIPWNDDILAKRVLEQGPDGIVIPMICSAEEARRAVAACRYPPAGTRGYGPLRAADYGLVGCTEFVGRQPPVIILQIEHRRAVESIDAILDTEGFDAVVFGPCDLSGSLGRLGALEDAELCGMIDHVLKKCRERGIPAGVSLGLAPAQALLDWKARGIRFLSAGNEYNFMQQGAALLRQVFPKEAEK